MRLIDGTWKFLITGGSHDLSNYADSSFKSADDLDAQLKKFRNELAADPAHHSPERAARATAEIWRVYNARCANG